MWSIKEDGSAYYNPEITRYDDVYGKNPRTVTLEEFIEEIESGEYSEAISDIRKIALGEETDDSEKEIERLKKNVPAYTISGKFLDGRLLNKNSKHSGLICLDIDLKHNKKKSVEEILEFLSNDKYVMVSATSISGRGAFAIIRIDEERHDDSYYSLEKYFKRAGFKIDASCKDPTRLRFTSFDTEINVNYDSEIFVEYLSDEQFSKESKKKKKNKFDGKKKRLPKSILRLINNGVKEGDRDNAAFDIACQVRDYGHSMKAAKKALKTFAGNCTPPFYDLDVKAKVLSAFKMKPRGSYDDEKPDDFYDDEIDLDSIIQNAADWNDEDLEPVDFIVEGIFEKGDIVEVVAKSKMGKSFLVLQASICLSRGSDFLGFEVNGSYRVCYVQIEIKKKWMHRRLKGMSRGLRVGTSGLRMLDIVNLRGEDPAKIMRVVELIANERDYDVIVIDPIYMIIDGDENLAKDWKPHLRRIQSIAEAGPSVIYVHHDSKGKQSSKSDADRGSGSGITGRFVDCRIILSEHEVEGMLMLSAMSRNTKPVDPITVCWDEGKFTHMKEIVAEKAKVGRPKKVEIDLELYLRMFESELSLDKNEYMSATDLRKWLKVQGVTNNSDVNKFVSFVRLMANDKENSSILCRAKSNAPKSQKRFYHLMNKAEAIMFGIEPERTI